MKQDVFMTEEHNKEIVKQRIKVKEMKPKEKWNDLGFKPTATFVIVAWICLGVGLISYCIGLWNSNMLFSEKGFSIPSFYLNCSRLFLSKNTL